MKPSMIGIIVLLGIIFFLLAYVLPMALIPAAIAEATHPVLGVLAGVAYTAMWLGVIVWAVRTFRGNRSQSA